MHWTKLTFLVRYSCLLTFLLRYSCHIPGLSQVAPASVNLHITQGEIGDKDEGNAQMLAMKLKG